MEFNLKLFDVYQFYNFLVIEGKKIINYFFLCMLNYMLLFGDIIYCIYNILVWIIKLVINIGYWG